MTDMIPWQHHQPVWSITADIDFPDRRKLTGCTCGETPSVKDYGPYWFSDHIAEAGAPDYTQTYWRHWDHVEAPHGVLDRDLVARELHDYTFVMEQVSTVYSELADLSKPNYHAHAILGVINDRQEQHYREFYVEQLCDRADEVDSAEVRAELLRLAEEWSPGSVEQYRRDREQVAEMTAKLAAKS